MIEPFPIVRHPAPDRRAPVLVSVPHYGTRPLPHITRDDYRDWSINKNDVGPNPNIRRVRLGLGGNIWRRHDEP